MFEQMEISKQVYEGVTPSKTTTREDSDRDSHVRKQKVVDAASPTNPKKGRASNSKKKYAGHPINRPTG